MTGVMIGMECNPLFSWFDLNFLNCLLLVVKVE